MSLVYRLSQEAMSVNGEKGRFKEKPFSSWTVSDDTVDSG